MKLMLSFLILCFVSCSTTPDDGSFWKEVVTDIAIVEIVRNNPELDGYLPVLIGVAQGKSSPEEMAAALESYILSDVPAEHRASARILARAIVARYNNR